jgi:hypothetical protein
MYLLADKLQDLATTNMVIDEIMQFSDITGSVSNYNYVYDHTTPYSPLRKMRRDYWMHKSNAPDTNGVDELSRELTTDILLEYMRIKERDWKAMVEKAFSRSLSENTKEDKCYYHQDDDKHPRCVSKQGSD